MLDHTTLNDLRAREFSRSIRGYSVGEVDEFIEGLLSEAAQLIDSVASLTQQAKSFDQEKEDIKKREEQLSATLILAQSTADEWKILARKDADQVIREAHIKAEEILQRAQRESEELIHQAQGRMRDLEESRSRLCHDLSLKMARLKGELISLKESMDRWEERASEFSDDVDESP